MFTELINQIDKAINRLSPQIINTIIRPEIAYKIDKIKIPPNDPFGIDKSTLKFASIFIDFFYKTWNRVEVFGIDNVPDIGPAILVPNHGGLLPLDAAHIATAMIVEHRQPRLVRTLVERFLPTLPFFYNFISRVGQTVGTYENAEIILDEGELLQIFPEGANGASKPYIKYYELDDFNVGFMELAIRKKVPIIPVGVTGSHEQALILFDLKPLAKLLHMPNLPIPLMTLLFGLPGALPLPSKYRIIFGKPMDFSEYDEEIINDTEKIKQLVEQVKSEVRSLINVGLDMRPIPFL